MYLGCRNTALHIKMNLLHYLSILINAHATRHVIQAQLQWMGVVHHHPGHSLINLFFLLVPEPGIHRTIILLIPFQEVDTLLYGFHLVVFFAGTHQVEAVHLGHPFRKLLKPNFKLDFVPEPILIIGSQGFIRSLKLHRKRCQIDKITNSFFIIKAIWVLRVNVERSYALHIVKFSFDKLADRLINIDILFSIIFCIHKIHVFDPSIVHRHQLLVYIHWTTVSWDLSETNERAGVF